MSTNTPYTFQEARQAERAASLAQKAAEDFVKESYKQHAHAEAAYRQGLAKRIVELRAEGKAATLCRDLARGDKSVTDLMIASMVADGVKEAAGHAAWRHNKDRDAVQRFVEWSMRRDLAEGRG